MDSRRFWIISIFVTTLLYSLSPAVADAQTYRDELNAANRAMRARDYAGAERALQSVLSQVDSSDANDDRALAVLNSLGHALRLQRKFADAEPIYLRVLNPYEARGDTNSVEYGSSLRNLGTLFDQAGNSDEAEPYYRRALAAFESVGSAAAEPAGRTLLSLGGLYARSGQYAGADTMYARAIELL